MHIYLPTIRISCSVLWIKKYALNIMARVLGQGQVSPNQRFFLLLHFSVLFTFNNRIVLLLDKEESILSPMGWGRRPRHFSFLRSLGWGWGLVVLSGGGTSGRMAFLMSVSISSIHSFALSAFLGWPQDLQSSSWLRSRQSLQLWLSFFSGRSCYGAPFLPKPIWAPPVHCQCLWPTHPSHSSQSSLWVWDSKQASAKH